MLEPKSDPAAAGIAQRLDSLPVTPLHIAAIALCTLGLFADIAEVALSNALGAVFLAPPHRVPQRELSLLLASVFAGGAIGAPLLGWFADRYGRRVALQSALVVLFFSSLAAAASPDIYWMTAFRFVSGLAIGAYPPLTAAYLADLLPPVRRGALMMICAALGFLGAPAIIFVIREFAAAPPLGIESWRWALAAGGIVSAIAAALFAFVPESPRWLATKGRQREADAACMRFEASAGVVTAAAAEGPASSQAPAPAGFRALAASPAHRGRAAFLAVLYMMGPWATIGFPLLSAAVLIQKGFQVRESLLFAALTMFGPTVGNLAAASFIDRIERRAMLVLCASIMIVAGLVFAGSTTLLVLIVAGVVFNLVSAVYSAALSVYGAELFPTALRASATAGAWGLSRVVSAFVPVALLPLLTGYGPLAMFSAITAALVSLTVLILTAGPPGLARKPVA